MPWERTWTLHICNVKYIEQCASLLKQEKKIQNEMLKLSHLILKYGKSEQMKPPRSWAGLPAECTSRVYQKNNYYINLPPSHVKSWSLRIQELGNRSFSEELLGIYYRNSCHIAEIWSCHPRDMSRICLKISSQSHHHGKCLERESSKASMI